MPTYRVEALAKAKANGHLKRAPEDLGRERHYQEDRPMGFPQLDQPYQPYPQSDGNPERKTKGAVQRTRSVATQSDIPVNTRDKKKKKKGRAPSPRTNRTSWMKTVSYDQGPSNHECHCDRHKKRDDKEGRKKVETTKRKDIRPRHSHPGRHDVTGVTSGDIPRPRVHDLHSRIEREPRQVRDVDMELTAVEEFKRKYDNRSGQVPRRSQPSPHSGEKFVDYNIVKTHGYYSDIEEDYIRQYRSLQL